MNDQNLTGGGYTHTEWHTGDVITAEKLNNMERGITDCYFNVYCIPGDYGDENVLDADTLERIFEVGGNGGLVVLNISANGLAHGVYLSVPGSFGYEFRNAFDSSYRADINDQTGIITLSNTNNS